MSPEVPSTPLEAFTAEAAQSATRAYRTSSPLILRGWVGSCSLEEATSTPRPLRDRRRQRESMVTEQWPRRPAYLPVVRMRTEPLTSPVGGGVLIHRVNSFTG